MKNDKPSSFSEKVDLGVRRGVAKALMEHKKSNRSIHVWKNGGIVEIPPKEIKDLERSKAELAEAAMNEGFKLELTVIVY